MRLTNVHKQQIFCCWLSGYDYAAIESNATLLNQEPLSRIDKTPYQQGRDAYNRGTLIEDCPYGPDSNDYHEWQSGWKARSAIDWQAKPLSLFHRLTFGLFK